MGARVGGGAVEERRRPGRHPSPSSACGSRVESLGGDEASAAGDDADHLRLAEDEVGAFLRVVGVDGHVGGAGER